MKIRTMRGYTLIELSIVIAVLGLILILLWRFGSMAYQRIQETEAPQILAEANQALVGFIMVNHRLPCPDTSTTGDGLEHCGGAVIGRLPVVTLGLARADMQNMRYGVYRSPTVMLDTASDRFPPLVTYSTTTIDPVAGYYNMADGVTYPYHDGTASASETLLGQVNGIDFCHALRLAGTSTANTTSLNIRDAGNAPIKNVAYALALPGAHDANGDGNLFDGANTGTVSFSASNQPVSANYDDVVQAVDFSQLFDRLSCGGALSAAEHAHFNAATAAALMHADFVNYQSQLQLTAELAQANYLIAAAAAVHAGGDVTSGAAAILFGTANLLTIGDPVGLVLGIVSQAVSVAGLAVAIAGAVTAQQAWSGPLGANQAILDFQPLLDTSAALETSIRADAFAADAAGLY